MIVANDLYQVQGLGCTYTNEGETILSQKWQVRQVSLQFAPKSWFESNGHELPTIRRITLNNPSMSDSGQEQAMRKRVQVILVLGLKSDSVGMRGKRTRRTLSSGVNQHGGLDALWEVRASDAVVREHVRLGQVRLRFSNVKSNVSCSWYTIAFYRLYCLE